MSRILFFADAHLRDRRGDEQYALQQIVDKAIALEVGLVVAAGDLLDRQTNRAGPIAFFYSQLDRLEKAGVEFVYIEGQHDKDDPPWLSGHRWARHLHRTTLNCGSFTLYGLNWLPHGQLQDELSEIPRDVNLLVAHQVWDEWMGSITSPQGSFSHIPEQVSRVVTGDYHQYKLESYRNAGGVKMTVCSPGATTQQRNDEPDRHYCVLLHADGTFKPHELKSRVFLDSDVLNRPEDVERFVSRLDGALGVAYQKAASADMPEELLKPRMRVTYSSTMPDTVRRIEKLVGDRAYLSFKELPPPERVLAPTAAARSGAAAVTPLSLLADEIDPGESPDEYALAERLLGAEDKELELARWWSEFMGDTRKEVIDVGE